MILAGVMGWPIAHSRSPRLHGWWLRHHGIDGAYVPLAVRPEMLEQALRALPVLGFAGCNLTIPHKELALPFLDHLDDDARRIGAANTIIVRPDGRLEGRNTDAFGFIAHLRASAPAWQPARRSAVVLGAGGAARAIVCALADAGVREIHIVNRRRDRAVALATAFGAAAAGWEDLPRLLAGAGLLVNATSLGMSGQPPLHVDLSPLPAGAVVDDIVYVPLETPLLAQARARGLTAVGGLGMLLHQARPGFEAWFGILPAVEPDLVALLEADIRG